MAPRVIACGISKDASVAALTVQCPCTVCLESRENLQAGPTHDKSVSSGHAAVLLHWYSATFAKTMVGEGELSEPVVLFSYRSEGWGLVICGAFEDNARSEVSSALLVERNSCARAMTVSSHTWILPWQMCTLRCYLHCLGGWPNGVRCVLPISDEWLGTPNQKTQNRECGGDLIAA